MGLTGGDGIASARAALARGESALVWRRQIADTDTPISAALKLFEADRGDFLLESVEGGAVRGRHSLIGLAPDLIFRADGNMAQDRKSTRLNSSHIQKSRMPSSA